MIFDLVLLFSTSVILIVWIYIKYLKYFKCLNHIPGPKGLPFLGNISMVQNLEDVLEILYKTHITFGKTYKLMFASWNFIITCDQKFIQFILTSNKIIRKGIFYHTLDEWAGEGLLISEGEKWKHRRKIITPSFHYIILEDFIHIFDNKGVLLINNLKQQLNNTSINIHKLISLYTLDVICETAMGTSVDAQMNPNHNDYVEAISKLCRVCFDKLTQPLNYIPFYYKLTKTYRNEIKYSQIIQDFGNNIINSRRNQTLKKAQSVVDEGFEIKRKLCLLDLLLSYKINGDPLSNKDISEEVHTFIFEGHDTTSMALSGALYSLANNQDIQEKAFAEINDIFKNDKDRPATVQDFLKMKYLELVIKEALRTYAIVPIYARELAEDIIYDGHIIPKSTHLVINQYALHKDPEQFPDPHKFDPERFSPENLGKRHTFSYLPFSAGPRNCIGQKFAMLELKSAISRVLRNFILLPAIPAHTLKLVIHVTLTPLNGILIQLKER